MTRAEHFIILKALKLWQLKNTEKDSQNWRELNKLMGKISSQIQHFKVHGLIQFYYDFSPSYQIMSIL